MSQSGSQHDVSHACAPVIQDTQQHNHTGATVLFSPKISHLLRSHMHLFILHDSVPLPALTGNSFQFGLRPFFLV